MTPIKISLGNGNTLIDIIVKEEHQAVTLDMLKEIWRDISDSEDIEYINAEVCGELVVCCVTSSQEQGSIVFVWDTNKQEFTRYYKAECAVKATVHNNMLYYLDIVSNRHFAMGYCPLGDDYDENFVPPPPEFDFDISDIDSIPRDDYIIDFEGDTPVIGLKKHK